MTIEEIFTRIANHMVEGLKLHHDISKGYDFLGLYGFSKCHEYHYLAETKGYECLLHYYSCRYHKLLNTENNSAQEIIPETWYKYTSMAVDVNTKRNATKTMMEKWVEWERDTKKLYQDMYKELIDIHEIAAADYLLCYISDVDDELKHAEKKLFKLEALGYDIGTIIHWQQPTYKKYKHELKDLYY